MSGNSGKVDNVSPYGYTPSRTVAAVFIILFLLSTLGHGYQAARKRMWWLFPTACLCGSIELLGWFSRLWSSFSPLASLPFEIQITATIIAPTPLLAASFVVLGKIIKILGPSYSRLSPKWYTIIFTTCDFFALMVQGAGGGIAASAADLQGANKGAHIMLFGIVFQLIVILGFSGCAIEYFIRYHTDTPVRDGDGQDPATGPGSSRGTLTPNIKSMTYALVFSTTCLFIRSIYRIIELSGGWTGRIIHTQIYFNFLDGVMIILAMYTLNFFHPGRLLGTNEGKEDKEMDYIHV